ncbi:hypothetical protein NQ317_002444 [Molorchus minor]|uniref:DDE Tnp4 domain-containing protein n=1 Tax=Molorchus minor TaxID=1323400 RepID=A0ABQ9J8I2_9CUCU|nr:hypothetical protein NQ317_002444 [Molorchus minor]
MYLLTMVDPLILDFFLDNESVTTVNRVVTDTVMSMVENDEFLKEWDNDIKRDFDNEDGSKSGYISPYDSTVSTLTPKQYKDIFKMSREIVLKLIEYLKSECKTDVGRMIVPFEKKVHILLYTLGSKESFKAIGQYFGVHKSSVFTVFNEMCRLVTECRFDYIQWPDLEEQDRLREKVTVFPNCIGFIDICQFHTKSALNNPVNSHLKNKEGQYNIVLQAVCDYTLKFIDIYVGEAGDMRDMQVYYDSPLSVEIENLVNPENHILGDSNFPLKMNLMTPFKHGGHTSDVKKMYIKAHSKARIYIRKALNRLTTTFKRVKFLDVKKFEMATIILCAACVLHNFIIIHEKDTKRDQAESDTQR